ncbi:MAG TPA: M20/M25/M40 family metallo-hydrolase, partial [Clostridiaceae bacterium]|nr:M20/M25/M40 family metallo-hydrolase [Clostridiaceae bacterium]
MPVQAYASSLISLCQNLIRAKSLSGQEEEVISVLKNYFVSRGIQTFTTDEYGSLIVTVRGKEKGPVILFDGHVDTVPVPDPDSWTHPPFEGRIHGNRIYGRGSSDMKGAVSAMAVAACDFLEASRGNFAGSLVFAGVVQEEVFEGVAARSISKICDPDVVIIGEATGLQLNIGQRGRAEIQVETLGVPAHSANPEKGFNAVYLMTDAIRKIREITPPRHPVLGPGILELTDIKSSPYPGASVVPSRCLA